MSTTAKPSAGRLTVGKMMIWIAGLAVLMAAAPMVASILVPVREISCRQSCLNNLRQLGLAVQGYANQHGSLPPAFVADASGRPLYSWRVLVLPYVDAESLYNDFRLDEPWDSPHNIVFSMTQLSVFRCPEHEPSRLAELNGDACTSYFALRGPATAFPGQDPVATGEITDRLGRTLLLVESVQGDVPWAAPGDIDAATGRLTWASPGDSVGPVSPHKASVNILMADGSVCRLDPAEFEGLKVSLSTIDGGEAVEIRDR